MPGEQNLGGQGKKLYLKGKEPYLEGKEPYLDKYNGKLVGIIGGGWNGAHIARVLAAKGYQVTLFEKNPKIFSGISGRFGIRLHVGPHYPRSPVTRETCRNGFNEFCRTYPDLVNKHERSIYVLGKVDARGRESKVNEETFERVCREFNYRGKIDLSRFNIDGKKPGDPTFKPTLNSEEVIAAHDLEEPSAVLGSRLREYFEEELEKANVTIRYNFSVTTLEKSDEDEKIIVGNETEVYKFDHVINTTSYQALLPRETPPPFNMKIVYQPCLALVYKDKKPSDSGRPVSVTEMDGSFPCLMPYDDRKEKGEQLDKYIMTHGSYTITSSLNTPEKAYEYLKRIKESNPSTFISEHIGEEKPEPSEKKKISIDKHVREPSEAHMRTFWPEFSERFEYQGWTGSVLAKIKTNGEFRGATVFQVRKNRVIYVFPGKITNIFDAEREVSRLMEEHDFEDFIEEGGYRLVKNGALHRAKGEITEELTHQHDISTRLQTFRGMLREDGEEDSAEDNDDFVTSRGEPATVASDREEGNSENDLKEEHRYPARIRINPRPLSSNVKIAIFTSLSTGVVMMLMREIVLPLFLQTSLSTIKDRNAVILFLIGAGLAIIAGCALCMRRNSDMSTSDDAAEVVVYFERQHSLFAPAPTRGANTTATGLGRAQEKVCEFQK